MTINALYKVKAEVERYYLQQANHALQSITDKMSQQNLLNVQCVALNYSILGELMPSKYQELSQDWSRRLDELTLATERHERATCK